MAPAETRCPSARNKRRTVDIARLIALDSSTEFVTVRANCLRPFARQASQREKAAQRDEEG